MCFGSGSKQWAAKMFNFARKKNLNNILLIYEEMSWTYITPYLVISQNNKIFLMPLRSQSFKDHIALRQIDLCIVDVAISSD